MGDGERNWLVRKDTRVPLVKRGPKEDYPEHERANRSYSQWISGYSEDEIAIYFNIPLEEAKKDIQHIQGMLPIRTIIAQNNDRNRILLQRTESDNYRKLIGEALKIPAKEYVAGGLAPAGILKEFRESVGMTEKPGGFAINIQQNNNAGNGAGISCSEDALRRVMSKMDTVIDIPAESANAREGDPATEVEEPEINEAQAIPDTDD